MTKKKGDSTHLRAAPAQPADEVVKASVLFTKIALVMKRGLFTGSDARVAAEAILFLEQVAKGEKSAEEERDRAAAKQGENHGEEERH